MFANVPLVKSHKYNNLITGIDEVSVYGIRGLVTGKILAKVGLFTVLVKFWELRILALGGVWAGLKRFFGFGPKAE